MTAPPADADQPAVHSPAAAYGLLAAIVCIWGINWPFMKIGLEWIPPFWFNFLRIALGTLTIILLLLWKRRLRFPDRADWPVIAVIGGVQTGLYMALVHCGLQYVPAGRAAILCYTTPIWVVPGALIFLGERLTVLRSVGLVTGVAGLIALFNPADFDWSDSRLIEGNAILLGAALCWAVGIVFVKRHIWRCTPLDALPWQLSIATAIALLLSLLFGDGPSTITLNETSLAILLYNGPVATALAVWVAISINRALPAVTTSLGFLGVPAVGLLSGALLLGEELTLSLTLGFVLIMGGVAIAAYADRKQTAGATEA